MAVMTSRPILHPRGRNIVASSQALRLHVEDQNFSGFTGIPCFLTAGSSISNGSFSVTTSPSRPSSECTGSAIRCFDHLRVGDRGCVDKNIESEMNEVSGSRAVLTIFTSSDSGSSWGVWLYIGVALQARSINSSLLNEDHCMGLTVYV